MLPSSVGKKIILKEVFPIAGITWKKGTSLATWNGPSLTNYLSQIFFFFFTIPDIGIFLHPWFTHIMDPWEYPNRSTPKNLKENIKNTVDLGQDRSQPSWSHVPHIFLLPFSSSSSSTQFHLYLSNRTTSVQTCCCLIKARDSVHLDRLPGSGQIRSSGQVPGSPLHHFLSPSIDFKKRVSHKHSKENK